MRIRTTLVFIFIFIVWYAVYQMFFSLIINVSFILSIAVVIWLVRLFKRFKNKLTPNKKEKVFLRKART